MPFALTFTGNIDPTALATFLLALLTLITVIVGGKALRQSQSEVDLSRREVEEAHRPVLIPIIDETKQLELWDAQTTHPVRPFFKDANRVVVPIKNIGSGPALNIALSVTPRNDAGEFSEASGDQKYSGKVVGLGVSEVITVTISIPHLGDLPNFELWLTYVDVAGKQWETSAKYLKWENSYAELSIQTAG